MRKNNYKAFRKSALAVITGLCLLGSSWLAAQTAPELMYFKFDGTGGTVLNEGTAPVVPSGVFTGTMTQGGNSQFNGGLQGDGQLTSGSNFSTGWRTDLSGSWTISLYIQNIQNIGFTSANLFGSTSHTGQSVRMYTNGFFLNTLTFAIPNSGFSPVGVPVTPGATFTVHVVHDAAAQTISIYIDGVLETSVPAPNNLTIQAPLGSEMLIGGHIQSPTLGRNIETGTLIDEFRLYNRALAASEVALTFNQELPLASNCDIPGNLQVTPAGVEALVDWTPGATNSGYIFEYGVTNFVPGTGTTVTGALPANAPPITISGLTPETDYDYYLSEICNSNGDTGLTLSGSFTTLVACPVPTQFAFDAPGGSEISFSYVSLGNNFEIEYGISGFTQGTGTIQTANGLADTITGLTQNTSYDVYIRQNCGISLQPFSLWEGPFTISTTCGSVNLPYIEDFNSSGWVVGSGANHSGSDIDNCWDRSPSSGYFWGAKDLPTTTRNSGPNSAFRGSNYMFAVANNGSSGSQAFLTSPQINLGSATDPVVRYYYHMFGSQMGSLVLEANDGSGWVGLDSISGQQQQTEFDPWEVREVSLNSISSSSVQLRFKAVRGTGGNSDIAIDALEVIDRGTCPTPLTIMPNGNQFGQITVSWPSTGAGSYEVQWGPSNFFQGTGLNLTTTTDTFFVVSAPAANCYRFLVRSVCGGTNGDFSRAFDVCLECLETAPYLQSFNGNEWVSGSFFNNNGSEIDSCWKRTPIWQGSNVFFWGTRQGTTSTGNTGPNGDNSPGAGGKYMFAVGYGSGGQEAQFISPYIDMSSLSRPGFRYFYHLAGGQIGSIRTEVQKVGETTWTIVDEIIGAQQTATTDPWLPRNIPIYDFAEDTVRIRLVAVRGAGIFNTGDHAIDDFEIFQDTSCTIPGNPQTVSIGSDSATVTWIDNGFNDFELLYAPAPFDPATANVVSVTGDSFTITGLDPETTYEVYVITLCGPNSISDTSQILSFNTACPPVYEAPYFTGFESGVWQSGTGSANANSVISSCWSRTASNNSYIFGTKVGPTTSSFFPFTGPTGAYNGNKYIVARNSGISTQIGNVTTITTPLIDVSQLSLPAVDFYYHMHGADMGTLLISYNDGSGWIATDSIVGAQQFATTDPWLLKTVELPNLTSDTIQIRFQATLGGQYTDIAFDDFEIRESAPCPAPFGLSGVVIDPNSIELNWTEVNPVTIEVAYGPQGLIPTSTAATIVQAPGGAPFLLDSLDADQCYDIFIRNNCNANGDSVSAWIGPITLCTPIDFDLESKSVIAPGGFCPDSVQPVSLVVTNNGFDAATGFDLGAEVFENGILQGTISATFNGSLNPGATDTLLIGTINTLNGGTFSIQAFTNLATDVNRFNDSLNRVLLVLDQNPVTVTQSADTICSVDEVTFIKDPSFAAPVGWFDNNNNLLATGDTFTTGLLTSDTTFVARGLITNGLVGPQDNTFGNNTGFFSQYGATAMEFTVNSWLRIDSVTIYPETPGMVNVELRTSPNDSLIANTMIEVPASFTGGAFRAALDLSLLPGNYRLAVDEVATTVTGLGRTSTNTQYPYTLNNDISITGNTSNEPAIYYFFYNWSVTVGDICSRPDNQLAVILGSAPTAAFTDDVATGTPGTSGFSVNFDASSSQGASQYSWDFGDGNTGTGVLFNHTYTSNGTFTVTLIATNPCGADTLVQTVVIEGISVEFFDVVDEIKMFPNPTTGNLSIELDMLSSSDVRIQIISSIGALVFEESVKQLAGGQLLNYDLSSLPAGTYSVRIAAGEAILIKKLIKL